MSLRTFAGVAYLALSSTLASAQSLLDPLSQPRFVNPLPIAARIDMTSGGYLEIEARQVQQNLGLYDPITGDPLTTTVWAYNGMYPGPTIIARRDADLDVRWINGLVGPNGPLPHLLPVDQSIMWANPTGYPESGVPIVTHLHGGHSESESDGLPEAWFTPGFAQTGMAWVKEVLHYDNDQEAATLWYHDHAMGITRLNVYAGLAGFYLLRDANEDALVAAKHLPTGPYEIEMVIQDRMFTTAGQLYYPSTPEEEDQPNPSHLPEFFGDVILVNGAAWPVLEVEPRQYRFRLLNGSDSRFYDLWLTLASETPSAVGLPKIYEIATDDGLVNAPLPINRILLGPAERYDIVIDFTGLDEGSYILRNRAHSPFPKGEAVDPNTAGQIMAFRVTKPLDTSQYPVTTLPSSLRAQPVAMPTPNAGTRRLLLFEGTDEYGRLQAMLGTTSGGAMHFTDAVTENPTLNDTEVWEIYNTTEDAHPIHIHLVAFRVLDRQKFRAIQDEETGALTSIGKIGRPVVPGPAEAGLKDTAIMYPGEVTRVVATFDREGAYVWHCHILSHEDHDMMRPYYVGPMASIQPQVVTSEVVKQALPLEIASVFPNPFNPNVKVRFLVKSAGRVEAVVFDVAGRMVRRLADHIYEAGSHELEWQGVDNAGERVASGVYFLHVRTAGHTSTRRLVLLK